MKDYVLLAGFVTVLLLLVGGLFVSVGRRLGDSPDRPGWWQVPGTIVAWEVGEPASVFDARYNGGRVIRFPVVEYPLPDGTLHRFRNRTTTQFDGRLHLGGQVGVLVDPLDPRRAELVETARQSRITGSIALALGWVLVLLGGLVGTGMASVLLR